MNTVSVGIPVRGIGIIHGVLVPIALTRTAVEPTARLGTSSGTIPLEVATSHPLYLLCRPQGGGSVSVIGDATLIVTYSGERLIVTGRSVTISGLLLGDLFDFGPDVSWTDVFVPLGTPGTEGWGERILRALSIYTRRRISFLVDLVPLKRAAAELMIALDTLTHKGVLDVMAGATPTGRAATFPWAAKLVSAFAPPSYSTTIPQGTQASEIIDVLLDCLYGRRHPRLGIGIRPPHDRALLGYADHFTRLLGLAKTQYVPPGLPLTFEGSFEAFACGQLRFPTCPYAELYLNTEPDSIFFFLWAEFALRVATIRPEEAWVSLARLFVRCEELYARSYCYGGGDPGRTTRLTSDYHPEHFLRLPHRARKNAELKRAYAGLTQADLEARHARNFERAVTELPHSFRTRYNID